jgi:hypothetical protein
MAAIEKPNDHCWKDVIPQADLALFRVAGETSSGRAGAVAIDLYDRHRGGPHPPWSSTSVIHTCGIFAHRAIAPRQLWRRAGASIDLLLYPGDASEQTAWATSRAPPELAARSDYREFASSRRYRITSSASIFQARRSSLFAVGVP